MTCTAIVSAMAEELRGLLEHLESPARVERGGRSFYTGRLGQEDVVLVLSGIGKVAAATTTAVLLTEFRAARVVFTGVAGGLGEGVQVGDLVVASELLQHDMDASPLFPRYEVPLYGRARFTADAGLSARVRGAAQQVLQALQAPDAEARGAHLGPQHLAAFGLGLPRLHQGLVLSGDRFVASASESAALRNAFPDALAVEMEGAAVAQVCHDFGLPFAVLRVVSDRADDAAHVDFGRFIADIASRYTVALVMALQRLSS